jgi:hypothetical protein
MADVTRFNSSVPFSRYPARIAQPLARWRNARGLPSMNRETRSMTAYERGDSALHGGIQLVNSGYPIPAGPSLCQPPTRIRRGITLRRLCTEKATTYQMWL